MSPMFPKENTGRLGSPRSPITTHPLGNVQTQQMHDWYEPAEETLRIGNERGLTVITPIIGEPVSPSSNQHFSTWWRDKMSENTVVCDRVSLCYFQPRLLLHYADTAICINQLCYIDIVHQLLVVESGQWTAMRCKRVFVSLRSN